MKKKLSFLLTALLFSLSPISLTSCGFFKTSTDELLAIKEITSYTNSDGNLVLKITYNDESKTPLVVTIPKGNDGKDAVGIENVSTPVPSEDGKYTKFTITYTDGTYTDFELPNGVSITGVEEIKDATSGVVTGIIFTYSDGNKSEPISLPRGEKGQDGRGIETITSSLDNDGNTILTIRYSDGTSENFTIPKAEKGEQGEPGKTWLYGNSEPSDSLGVNGDFYFNTSKTAIYLKVDGSWKLIASFTTDETEHTLTFNPNGVGASVNGQAIYSVKIKHGDYFALNKYGSIPFASRENYTFLGWSATTVMSVTDGYFTNFTPVMGDLTLYAIWEAN